MIEQLNFYRFISRQFRAGSESREVDRIAEKYLAEKIQAPSASELAALGDVVADAPERLLALHEERVRHRNALEKEIICRSQRRATMKIWSVPAVLLLGVLLAWFFGFVDYTNPKNGLTGKSSISAAVETTPDGK